MSAKMEEGHLVIGISDQGRGLSLHDQAKLFGPFQRLEQAIPHEAKGIGLGLLVCRTAGRSPWRTHLGRVRTWPGFHLLFYLACRLEQ